MQQQTEDTYSKTCAKTNDCSMQTFSSAASRHKHSNPDVTLSHYVCVWGSCIYMLDFHVVFCFFHFSAFFLRFWDILRFFEIFWAFEIFWDFLRYFEIFWDILKYFEIFLKNILRYFEIFWDFLRYVEIFWDFLRYFQKKWKMFFFGRSPIRFFQVFN